jgi:hypothetical protein
MCRNACSTTEKGYLIDHLIIPDEMCSGIFAFTITLLIVVVAHIV